jgi:hypothetical protein
LPAPLKKLAASTADAKHILGVNLWVDFFFLQSGDGIFTSKLRNNVEHTMAHYDTPPPSFGKDSALLPSALARCKRRLELTPPQPLVLPAEAEADRASKRHCGRRGGADADQERRRASMRKRLAHLVGAADPSCALALFPAEVWYVVASLLDARSLGRLSLVSKAIAEVANDERLWRPFLSIARFPPDAMQLALETYGVRVRDLVAAYLNRIDEQRLLSGHFGGGWASMLFDTTVDGQPVQHLRRSRAYGRFNERGLLHGFGLLVGYSSSQYLACFFRDGTMDRRAIAVYGNDHRHWQGRMAPDRQGYMCPAGMGVMCNGTRIYRDLCRHWV